MGKASGGSGMTRGARRRNARRERLRELLPRDGAVIGIDLAEDKQAIAVIDHDVRVLARKTVRVKVFRLGEALDWAVGQARGKGFAAVTVACEPTGPRWMQVQRLCAERGLPLVCVQPLVSHIAREQQDYTTHKTDESDCVMIARLAVELHCYIPEELDETWAHLRNLGRRRAQLITAATASVQRIRDWCGSRTRSGGGSVCGQRIGEPDTRRRRLNRDSIWHGEQHSTHERAPIAERLRADVDLPVR